MSNAISYLMAIATVVNYASAFGLVGTSKQTNFNLSSDNCFTRQLPRFQHRSVSLSSVDSIVSADDESEYIEEEEEEYIVSAEELAEIESEQTELKESDQFLHKKRLTDIRAKYARDEKDTGSPEFQIAGMTERITYLTTHLKENPKDYSTRRGLVALVNKRRRLLNYLARENVTRYVEVVAALGIRHRAPGRVASREETYGRFPKQKNPRKS